MTDFDRRIPQFSETSAVISKAAEASRNMTPLQRLDVMLRAGLVTERDAEDARRRYLDENK